MQLHCPPSAVIEDDATYDALDALVEDGAIAAYGVSVETVDQALAAIARPHLATVQIILNALRLKPLEQVLPAAVEAGVGIIARVPLASGLLSGKYDESTTFADDDHRNYNRDGSAFDVGETFSGVPYDVGPAGRRRLHPAVEDLRPGQPDPGPGRDRVGWQQPGVSSVIPGARNERAGAVQRRGGRGGQPRRRVHGRRPGDLRRAGPRARPRPLVTAPAPGPDRTGAQ